MNREDLTIASVLNNNTEMDEYEVTFAQKWNYIKQIIPMPNLDIMRDFESKAFEEVYKDMGSPVLDCFIFAAQLRMEIFENLLLREEDHKKMKHLELCAEAAEVWYMKLTDKKEAIELEEEIKHIWLN